MTKVLAQVRMQERQKVVHMQAMYLHEGMHWAACCCSLGSAEASLAQVQQQAEPVPGRSYLDGISSSIFHLCHECARKQHMTLENGRERGAPTLTEERGPLSVANTHEQTARSQTYVKRATVATVLL